jgi:hypothetical protein
MQMCRTDLVFTNNKFDYVIEKARLRKRGHPWLTVSGDNTI